MGRPDDTATEVLPAAASPSGEVDSPSAAAPPVGALDASSALLGRTLGKFVVRERLGRGGSGEVFRAEQPQLGRSAVIKVLRREVAASPNRVERFLREAKLASRLDHPYAAHVYAFGVEPDGVLWIAMEHVRGVTLDELVGERGPMPPAVFGPLFGRLCEVVHTAHELGIIHRDIKGSNVMVIERAGQLLPKLLDFGIAKGEAGELAPGIDGDGLTGHGATLGSPHYMAPEQWLAPAGVDARADIYALGVLAYRCVGGEVPFHGMPRARLAHAHQTLPPPPLPAAVPPAIAEVIARALAKSPELRWPSALALGEAMQRAAGASGAAPALVLQLDPATRDTWAARGPQPIADAIARLARATALVDADAELRELIAITCRWVAVIALAHLPATVSAHPSVREHARAIVGRDDAAPWLRLARAAAAAAPALPGLAAALADTAVLEALAARLDASTRAPAVDGHAAHAHAPVARDRARTAAALAAELATLPDALRPLEALLAYHLVVGRAGGAESWRGVRRRVRERVVVWGEPLAAGEVALLDGAGRVVARLSPLVQVRAPLPAAEPELFLLWRSARGAARLVAAPWGFERDDDAAAARLAALTTEDADTVANPADDACPYPGLHAYGVDDAERFVGREREVETLANRLVRAPLVAVLGPSGAGKSSFLHAGLLPRLADSYALITVRPGRHPLHALAAQVMPAGNDASAFRRVVGDPAGTDASAPRRVLDEPAGTHASVRRRVIDEPAGTDASARRRVVGEPVAPATTQVSAPRSVVGEPVAPATTESSARRRVVGEPVASDAEIVDRLRALGERAPRGLVIVIDQLEELVTLCADAGERDRFAAVVGAAASDRAAPVRVVVTLRDDFATVIESVDAFRGRFDVFVLATPPPEALRRIVTEPARRAQVTVEPAVVDAIVAEVAGRPASLPLLSFTAARLWEARDRTTRRITHDAYVALGGVQGALSAYADHVYGSLARRDQDVVRDLFARLVSADGTRIPVPRSELEQIAGAAGVLAHLIDARLLVVREDDGIDVVELVHECLATRWERLARWRSEDAADRALLGDVRAAARRWHEAGGPRRGDRRGGDDLLWRGAPLVELRKLAARSSALTATERAFAEAADRAERRARKLRRTLVAGAMAVLAAVAVVMAYLGVAATRSRTAAEEHATTARRAAQLAEDRLTASLIAQGRRELNDDRALPALAYFGEALRRGADTPALRFMIAVASRGWRHQVRAVHGAGMTAAASGDGWIATADQHARLHLWGPEGRARGELATGAGAVAALRPAGDRLLVVGRDAIVVVDPLRAEITGRITPPQPPIAAALGPGADEVTVLHEDAIRVLARDGSVRRTLAIAADEVTTTPVFAPDGRHVTLAGAGAVRIVELRAMTSKVIAEDIEGVLGARADGGLFGYVGRDGAVRVHAGDGTLVRTFTPEPRGHAVVFSDDGERIGVLSQHELTIHDAAGAPLHAIPVPSPLALFAIRGDHTWVADPDGVVAHYRESYLVASLPSHLGEVRALHVRGDLALTIGGDGSLVISRAGAAQLVTRPRPCAQTSFAAEGIAVAYHCADGQHVLVGATEIGQLRSAGFAFHAYDPASGRGAISERELVVFERGQPIARAAEPTGYLGALAFDDRDHLLVAHPEGTAGVWRWTIGTERWEHVAAVAQAVAVAAGAGGIFVGTDDGHVVLVRDGREVHRASVGGRVAFVVASGDRAWIAATLTDGGTAILDGRTGALVRQLEPGDASVGAATLDGAGDLLLRSGRGTMTVWDRASGEALVFALDLLADMQNAAWAADGRIEVAGREVGVLDIPRETRPAAAIAADIACRVPLRVRDGKLEPAPPECL